MSGEIDIVALRALWEVAQPEAIEHRTMKVWGGRASKAQADVMAAVPALLERIAALEAEVTRQETLRLHEGQKLQNHIAALEAKLEIEGDATDTHIRTTHRYQERIAALEAEVAREHDIADACVQTRNQAVAEARREGAREALEWFVRQPRSDDSVGWVLTKSYDQMIDAALGL